MFARGRSRSTTSCLSYHNGCLLRRLRLVWLSIGVRSSFRLRSVFCCQFRYRSLSAKNRLYRFTRLSRSALLRNHSPEKGSLLRAPRHLKAPRLGAVKRAFGFRCLLAEKAKKQLQPNTTPAQSLPAIFCNFAFLAEKAKTLSSKKKPEASAGTRALSAMRPSLRPWLARPVGVRGVCDVPMVSSLRSFVHSVGAPAGWCFFRLRAENRP